jgi:RecG-like helicase
VQYHRLGIAIVDEQHRFGVVDNAKNSKTKTAQSALIGDVTLTAIPRP